MSTNITLDSSNHHQEPSNFCFSTFFGCFFSWINNLFSRNFDVAEKTDNIAKQTIPDQKNQETNPSTLDINDTHQLKKFVTVKLKGKYLYKYVMENRKANNEFAIMEYRIQSQMNRKIFLNSLHGCIPPR